MSSERERNQIKTLGQLYSFLDKVFGGAKVSGSGDNCNINVICPVCKEKNGLVKSKLAIKADKLWTKCWICGYKSLSVHHLIKKYYPDFLKEFIDGFCNGIIPVETEDSEEPTDQKLELPSGFSFLAEQFENPKNIVAAEAKRYLLSRGATMRDFWYFKFGTTMLDKHFKFRVIIPSYDANGELNYFTGRATMPVYRGPKYYDAITSKDDIIFNELNIDWNKELTIVEGPFDLIKCNDNATCLLGSSLEAHHKLFQEIAKHDTPVLLALDNDAQKKQLKIAKLLAEYGIQVRLYSVPSHLNDVGQMTKEEFIHGISSAKPYSLENDLQYRMSIL